MGLEGHAGWMMCKNDWPLIQGEGGSRAPGVNTGEIPEGGADEMIVGGQDEVGEGEKADMAGEDRGDVPAR